MSEDRTYEARRYLAKISDFRHYARHIMNVSDGLAGDFAYTLQGFILGKNKRIAEVEQERDKAQANYDWMVQNAIDNKLPAYREQGQKMAELEQERDQLRQQLAEQAVYSQHLKSKIPRGVTFNANPSLLAEQQKEIGQLKHTVEGLRSELIERDGGTHDGDCTWWFNSDRCNCGHNQTEKILTKSTAQHTAEHDAKVIETAIDSGDVWAFHDSTGEYCISADSLKEYAKALRDKELNK
jgi:multidrug efflux pump subunit AcrA (membrane-fusion protein)